MTVYLPRNFAAIFVFRRGISVSYVSMYIEILLKQLLKGGYEMTAKKRLLPILVAVLMVFAMMPMTAGTVFADDGTVYTVSIEPGE